MLHLFNKIYLATDSVIDNNIDRVVISDPNGIDVLDYIKNDNGELLAYGKAEADVIGSGKTYTSYVDMFDTLGDKSTSTGKRIVIYADDTNFNKIIAHFYKTMFANPDKTACTELLTNTIFKYDVFGKGRFSRNAGNTDLTTAIDISSFGAEFDAATVDSTEKSNFVTKFKAGFNIEVLLATYYNNGDTKSELKDVIKVLMKKDLEKYLLELKEIFFVHLLNKSFTDKLSLAKTYDWSNYNDVLSDSTTYADLFLTDRIWSYKYMNFASTGDNVKFDGITSTDVTNFKQFTTISGSSWSEENVYTQVKSDVNKLDFLDIYTDFTDTRLTNLLDAEATFENAAGSFFSIDLETVNHYFVQTILENKTDNTFLAKYSIT
jgi:hypothetical protein